MITPIRQRELVESYAHRLRMRLQQLALFFAIQSGRNGAEVPSSEQLDRLDFETFFRQFELDIFTYLWRMTGEIDAAYDLSQETFLRAWQHYDKISNYDEPRAWLFRVATNLAINYRRRRTNRTNSPNYSPENKQPDSESDSTEYVVEQDYVRQVLLAIPGGQRAVLVLHDVYGLTCEEIASTLRITLAATKMRLCRGREEFRVRYLHREA
ncbi:MAG: RNA polymerase sigma factor [Ktedonobacterales bacterium]